MQKKIKGNDVPVFTYWTNLIHKSIDEIDREVLLRTGLPHKAKLVSFAEYRAWARSLRNTKGWSKEID